MFRNIFKIKESLIIILASFLVALTFISLFIYFLPIKTIIFTLLTLSLTFFSLTFTTIQYQKYSRGNIVKRTTFNNIYVWQLKIYLFLKILIFSIIYLVIWLFLFYIFWLFGIGFNPEISSQLIIWKNVHYSLYFYYGIMEIISIIIFGYVINHFLPTIILIYGAIVIISIYLLVFGGLFYSTLRTRTIDGAKRLVWINDNNHLRLFFNGVFLPWSNFDLFGKNVFWGLSSGKKQMNWFDMSYMNQYANTTYGYFFENITWIPFVISGFYLSLPFIFPKKQK